MQRQSGVMVIRSLRSWLGLKTDDFTLVTFEDQGEDLDVKVNRLATGSWEHCRGVMENLTPVTLVADHISEEMLIRMLAFKKSL